MSTQTENKPQYRLELVATVAAQIYTDVSSVNLSVRKAFEMLDKISVELRDRAPKTRPLEVHPKMDMASIVKANPDAPF
jgi:hypothetical protein